MRLRAISVFLFALVFSVPLLLAQNSLAVEPGPLTPEKAKIMMEQQKENLLILDVRNPNEYITVHYPGALNIPVNELQARLSEVPIDKPVLVHCALGIRAQRGYEILKEKRPDIKELYFINGKTIFNE